MLFGKHVTIALTESLGADELWDKIIEVNNAESQPYPYEILNNMTHGLRCGELVTICAGSGIGKSLFCHVRLLIIYSNRERRSVTSRLKKALDLEGFLVSWDCTKVDSYILNKTSITRRYVHRLKRR